IWRARAEPLHFRRNRAPQWRATSLWSPGGVDASLAGRRRRRGFSLRLLSQIGRDLSDTLAGAGAAGGTIGEGLGDRGSERTRRTSLGLGLRKGSLSVRLGLAWVDGAWCMNSLDLRDSLSLWRG